MSGVLNRFRPARLAGVALFALVAPSIAFAAAPTAPKKGVTIEGITEYRLDNGLGLLLFPDPSASTVTVNLTVLVGSRHEGYGETGMAHLLEHMLFKGTPTHSNIPKELRDHGARYNGQTSYDRTNYFETMPASDSNLDFGLALEADRLVHSLVRREDLVSEMTVVRNEFEAGENNPTGILFQRMMAAAYEWHNYGKTTIGNRTDIERVPIDKLQAFYHKYYRPDNALLIIAGKFDESKALDYVTKYFGVLKRPDRPVDATYTEEPTQDGERVAVLRRVGSVGVAGLLYHIPAGAHEDFAPVQVLEELLTSEPSGRLYKALVVTKLASTVQGFAQGLHDPGVLVFLAPVEQQKSSDEVRDTLIRTLEELAKEKVTAEEVERAKRRLLKDRELLMTQSSRIGVELSNWASQGDWRLFFLHRDRLSKVTADDVNRVAERYLRSSNRTVGLFLPTMQPHRAEIPETPALAELLKNYKGSAAVAAGEAFEPTPANIEKRTLRGELPGGIRVALLPRKTRGQSVVAELTFRFGNADSLKGQATAAELMGPLLTRGTKRHNRQQLQDELDKLKARVSVGSGGGFLSGGTPGQLTVNVQCKRDTLPSVLQLVREVLQEPTFPQEELEVLKRQRSRGLEQNKNEPIPLAVLAFARKLNPYSKDDVRYTPTLEESIQRVEAVTREQIDRLYNEQVGARAGEFVIVGDFDAQAVQEPLREIVSGLHGSQAYAHIPQVAHQEIAGSRQDILTPDKANAIFVGGYQLAISDTEPDFPALQLANFILGEAALSSRLAARVRQKEGLSYTVGSQLSADAKDKFGRFLVFAICNPKNIDKVDHAIADELAKFIKSGVDAHELEEAKKAFLEQMKVLRANDSQLAAMLQENLYAGRTFDYYADLETKIAALTPEALNQAIRKYVLPERMVIVRGGDLRKKAEQKK
jgi:zinc protease